MQIETITAIIEINFIMLNIFEKIIHKIYEHKFVLSVV
jgi:hypothetical protein